MRVPASRRRLDPWVRFIVSAAPVVLPALGGCAKLPQGFEARLHRIRALFAAAFAAFGLAAGFVLSQLGVALRDRLGALARAHRLVPAGLRVLVGPARRR